MNTINHILRMKNPIQQYAWGSQTAIANLMGLDSPSAQPQAELWMGAHPKASSKVWYDDRWQPLDQLIEQYPKDILGTNTADRFDDTLPYLFKILAAGQPLSIQAHPDIKQAQEGFQRENLQGIALDAPQRNYKDDRHKPECMCALTTFWGLCGFRPLADMMTVIGPVWPLQYNHALAILTQSFNTKGLQSLFEYLMQLDEKPRKDLVHKVVNKAMTIENDDSTYEWIIKLNEKYPGDIGVLSPLLLNIVKLEPGEAMFLPARQLHAYLDGMGIELMANSDNVLRGGITHKYIDVDELITILDFNPGSPEILALESRSDTEKKFNSPVEEFALSELACGENTPHSTVYRSEGPEIILCVEGEATIQKIEGSGSLKIWQGQSVLVPSAVENYVINGNALLYKASVNL